MMKIKKANIYSEYEAAGPEATELRAIADTAIFQMMTAKKIPPPAGPDSVELEWLRIGKNLNSLLARAALG
jgi:hypothetical protein